MKKVCKILLTCLLVPMFPLVVCCQTDWQIQTTPILTRWAKEVNPLNTLPEYPRPQMQRSEWSNLNGLWNYAISDSSLVTMPSPQGKILVPFPLESSLSGVNKALQPNQKLWYKRFISISKKEVAKHYLLHFGAVDFETAVWINGKYVGNHTGGYQEFYFDISWALHKGSNEIIVAVKDPTDAGNNPRGKQTLRPHGIMYTSVSGIWQTVWLETVPPVFIEHLKLTPDVDAGILHIESKLNQNAEGYTVEVYSNEAGKASGKPNSMLSLPVANAHLWSPHDPYLYDLSVRLLHKGKIVDSIKSYFGMRKIEIKKDSLGQERIFLNNTYTFNLGVLDQGYWPDGIYTAPTDSALKWDIQTIKQMGFNTIRKHIKIEPARWYHYCDKLGMLVWQDMPYPANLSAAAKNEFETESVNNIKQRYNSPSIVLWVVFNEGWNKYDQERITNLVKKMDTTRVVNGHSGENYDKTSPAELNRKWINADLTDIHDYPGPNISPYIKGKARVLGEWGGIRVSTLGHKWKNNGGWGYIESAEKDFVRKYHLMMKHLKVNEEEGLSGAIYTQPFDVETEENGFITYDRYYFKISVADINRINNEIFKTPCNNR